MSDRAGNLTAARLADRRQHTALGLSLVLTFFLAACGNSADAQKQFALARRELTETKVSSLGQFIADGTFGSTGISGGPPTAYTVIRVEAATDQLMVKVDDQMRQAGFSPFVPCRPPLPCSWERRANKTLLRARATVKGPGETWGTSSSKHGTVAPGTRVLEVTMTAEG